MSPTAALLEELRLLRAMGDVGRAAAAKALRTARLASIPSTEADPMKLLAHDLDAAVVDRGGGSIFAAKPRGTLSAKAEQRLAAWAFETPRRHPDAPGRKPDERPLIAKPGRLVGTLTGKLGGFASDREDER